MTIVTYQLALLLLGGTPATATDGDHVCDGAWVCATGSDEYGAGELCAFVPLVGECSQLRTPHDLYVGESEEPIVRE
jgi:hypothetical protein